MGFPFKRNVCYDSALNYSWTSASRQHHAPKSSLKLNRRKPGGEFSVTAATSSCMGTLLPLTSNPSLKSSNCHWGVGPRRPCEGTSAHLHGLTLWLVLFSCACWVTETTKYPRKVRVSPSNSWASRHSWLLPISCSWLKLPWDFCGLCRWCQHFTLYF